MSVHYENGDWSEEILQTPRVLRTAPPFADVITLNNASEPPLDWRAKAIETPNTKPSDAASTSKQQNRLQCFEPAKATDGYKAPVWAYNDTSSVQADASTRQSGQGKRRLTSQPLRTIVARRVGRASGPELHPDREMGLHKSHKDLPSHGSDEQQRITDVTVCAPRHLPSMYVAWAYEERVFDFAAGIPSELVTVEQQWQELQSDIDHHWKSGCALPMHEVCERAERNRDSKRIAHVGHTEVWALYYLWQHQASIKSAFERIRAEKKPFDRVRLHMTSLFDPCDWCSKALWLNAHRTVARIANVDAKTVSVVVSSLLRYGEATLWRTALKDVRREPCETQASSKDPLEQRKQDDDTMTMELEPHPNALTARRGSCNAACAGAN